MLKKSFEVQSVVRGLGGQIEGLEEGRRSDGRRDGLR